jgi:methylthioribose-1-phosphate isomerase
VLSGVAADKTPDLIQANPAAASRASVDAARLRIVPASTAICNPAFDVTPADLVTGIICEFGVIAAGDLACIASNPPRTQ